MRADGNGHQAKPQVSGYAACISPGRVLRESQLRLLAAQLVQGIAHRGGSLVTLGATPLRTELPSRLMSPLEAPGRLASIRMAWRP